MTPAQLWTVREVLAWTSERFAQVGVGSARLDAEVLLAHALDLQRVGLYLDLDRPLSEDERGRYRALVSRRLQREPVAYLVGEREFWSRVFGVDARVLVPRPETETLVEQALITLRDFAAPRVLDVGTGSGVLAVTIAAERPDARVLATDISVGALEVAAANAARHDVEVTLHAGDLLEALPPAEPAFDLVVANLPYVSPAQRDTLAPELLAEPAGALFADEDGLALLRRLIAETPGRLRRPGGALLLEVGLGQAAVVRQLLIDAGISDRVTVHRDLAGIERVVTGRLPPG
jgi:release factor glutamine methyltransferase